MCTQIMNVDLWTQRLRLVKVSNNPIRKNDLKNHWRRISNIRECIVESDYQSQFIY